MRKDKGNTFHMMALLSHCKEGNSRAGHTELRLLLPKLQLPGNPPKEKFSFSAPCLLQMAFCYSSVYFCPEVYVIGFAVVKIKRGIPNTAGKECSETSKFSGKRKAALLLQIYLQGIPFLDSVILTVPNMG